MENRSLKPQDCETCNSEEVVECWDWGGIGCETCSGTGDWE